jgi:hypothetical protein
LQRELPCKKKQKLHLTYVTFVIRLTHRLKMAFWVAAVAAAAGLVPVALHRACWQLLIKTQCRKT